jgi:hypothetical protein
MMKKKYLKIKKSAAGTMRRAAMSGAFLTLVMVFVATLAGCGGADENADDDKSDSGGKLNPPAWLIGKWEREDGKQGEDITVTSHNVTVSSGNLDFSYQLEKEYMSDFKETLNGTLYTLSYVTEHPAGEPVTYAFEPADNGKMKLTITMSFAEGSFIYVKKK